MGLIEKIKRTAMDIHASSKGSHDWEHTLRVYTLAARLAKLERVSLRVVKLAALLHDIARGREDASGGKIDHAAQGAKEAFGIMKSLGASDKLSAATAHCIETHRFRGKLRPLSAEAKVLFDADKLDSIGAVGIGRAFLFAGEVGAKLHNKRGDILRTKAYTQEDTAYREYMVKLRHVKSRMLTKTGRRLAVKRHKFMEDFFKRLNSEVEGKI
jgi:uncharacterized protein